MGEIRIGIAGWDYKDWAGIVYPQPAGSKFDPLAYVANYFDVVEINSSFYRPPSAKSAKSWVDRVQHNPRFMFTAKLYRVFTHDCGKATSEDEKAVREGMDVIVGAGRFGALLLQFPWSFKNTDESREYLVSLLDRFKDYPLVLEVRHASWNKRSVYQSLETRGVGFCNIDQPLYAKSIEPSARATSTVGYVRLHGRNYKNWFAENRQPSDRYDYLYTEEELEPWIENIREVMLQTATAYATTNNHFLGKGPTNALQLRAAIEGRKVAVPGPLLASYPQLEKIAQTVSADEN